MRRVLSPIPIAVILGVAALVGLLVYGIASKPEDPSRARDEAFAAPERKAAPALQLPRLSGGGTGSLAQYKGKVVVLNFWASWCEPCRAESPVLERWHRRLSRHGGTVLGVDILDVASDGRAFAREFGLTYPMLRDGSGDSLDDFDIVGYPETAAIDRRGRIVALKRGPVDEAWLRRYVGPLLRERS